MNRIIIVGNGFDIAHGLRTGYKDFIKYLQDEYIDLINRGENNLVIKDHSLFYLTPAEGMQRPEGFNEYEIQPVKKIESWDDLPDNLWVVYAFRVNTLTQSSSYKAQVSFKNKLLGYIFNNSQSSGWGGFENDYKDILVHIIKGTHKKANGLIPTNYTVEQLNQDLGEIITLFCKYLQTEIKAPKSFTPEVASRLFTKPLVKWRINAERVSRHGAIPIIGEEEQLDALDNILFLSFNYTSTAETYLVKNGSWQYLEPHSSVNKESGSWGEEEKVRPPVTSIRYIHGDLADGDPGSIIFGYGDELDENQAILETLNNEFLKHIKSVLYTRSPYYRELIDFVDADKFDIVIYGHSCSNTDRTLLNTLFEHENCVSIQPFLYSKDDTSIYTNIYRCFKDKKLMRARVVDQTNTIRAWGP